MLFEYPHIKIYKYAISIKLIHKDVLHVILLFYTIFSFYAIFFLNFFDVHTSTYCGLCISTLYPGNYILTSHLTMDHLRSKCRPCMITILFNLITLRYTKCTCISSSSIIKHLTMFHYLQQSINELCVVMTTTVIYNTSIVMT